MVSMGRRVVEIGRRWSSAFAWLGLPADPKRATSSWAYSEVSRKRGTMNPNRCGLCPLRLIGLLVTVLCSFPQQGTTQTLAGIVLDQETGDPIEGVTVNLLDVDERAVAGGLSGATGGFIIRAPWTGRFQIRFERIGYATVTSTEIDLLPQDTVAVEMRLSVQAVELAPLTIISDRQALVLDARIARWGYYERVTRFGERGSGVAHFLDYDAIEKRRPGRVTDLFTDLSGVRVMPSGRRGLSVRSIRPARVSMSNRGCGLTFYLDGVRILLDRDESINDYVIPTSLAAVEVYVTAPYPLQYSPAGADCGSIVVWTGWVSGKGKRDTW